MHRVAIVDDSPDVRALWRAELESSGQFTVCAEGDDGRQATEIALTCRPDVMLLDLSMPGLGGMQALPAIGAASPQTRVVVLSALGRDQFSRAALSRGAVAFLEKHLPAGSLVARLHEALDGPDARGTEGQVVLVVEPDRDDAALLHYLLGWLGCRALQARSGAEALDLVATSPATIALVAGALPDMTVTQFAAQLRQQEPAGARTALVVMLNAPSDGVLVGDTADAMLTKPVEAEPLQTVLRRHGACAPSKRSESLVETAHLAALSERIGAETLRDIARGFREATRERLSQLHVAAGAGDTETVSRLAHQINGSARSLAAPVLACVAEDLEHTAPTCSAEELRKRAQRLQSLFDDTDRVLTSTLPHPRTSEEDVARHATAGPVRRGWRHRR